MKNVLLLVFLFPFTLFAQKQPAVGSWNIYNMKLELNKSWSIMMEGQVRSTQFYRDFYYYELKGGIGYRVNRHISVLLGAGDYNTYQEGGDFVSPKSNKETRTWLQFTLNQRAGKLKVEHRTRIEQRFGTQYHNRYRYRLACTLPIAKVSKRDFFLNVSDEVFFGDETRLFMRNRLFAGLGYVCSPQTTLQAGILRQLDDKNGEQKVRDFLQVSLLVNLKLKRDKR